MTGSASEPWSGVGGARCRARRLYLGWQAQVLENASGNLAGLDERDHAPAAAAAGAAQHVELEDAAKQRCPIEPSLAGERWT